MTAAAITDDQRRAVENVLFGYLLRHKASALDTIHGGSMLRVVKPMWRMRLADARTVADMAGLDLTLAHFAPLVAVIEQAIALPDRPEREA